MMLNKWFGGLQFLAFSFAVFLFIVLRMQAASAQSTTIHSPAQTVRHSTGWQPTTRISNAGKSNDRMDHSASAPKAEAKEPNWRTVTPTVQTAYYQAQESLSDGFPQFPGNIAPTGAPLPLPNGNAHLGTSAGASAMVSPPVYPAPEVSPPQQFPTGNAGGSTADSRGITNQGLPGPPIGSRAPVQQSIQSADRGRVPAQMASSELRPPPGERIPNQPTPGSSQIQSGQRQNGPGQAVQQSTLPAGHGMRTNEQPVTSGYPFVTPAPRSRYATSPYQPAVFQTPYQSRPISAQLASSNSPAPNANLTAAQQPYVPPQPAAVVPPPTAATAATVPPSQYLTQQQMALPQYQFPQAGIIQTAYQCTPAGPTVPSTGAVPGTYLPPTLPPNLTPGLYTPNNSGYTPLFSLGQENYNVQLGRGVIGQPTVYVAGQPIRNFMRYLSP